MARVSGQNSRKQKDQVVGRQLTGDGKSGDVLERPAQTEKISQAKPAETSGGNVILDASLVSGPVAGDRSFRIAQAAYYKAERRGFQPGGEVADWLEAERELDEQEGAGGIG